MIKVIDFDNASAKDPESETRVGAETNVDGDAEVESMLVLSPVNAVGEQILTHTNNNTNADTATNASRSSNTNSDTTADTNPSAGGSSIRNSGTTTPPPSALSGQSNATQGPATRFCSRRCPRRLRRRSAIAKSEGLIIPRVCNLGTVSRCSPNSR